MNRQEMEAIRLKNAAIVKDICAQYGLYGNVILYNPSPVADSSLNRMYIVAGMDPCLGQDTLPKLMRPDEMLRALQRNEKLFCPKFWVLDLTESKSDLSSSEALADYCETASFLARLYSEYNTPLPPVLRHSEVKQLLNFSFGACNTSLPPTIRKKYEKDLTWFFNRENSKSQFRQKWLRYFRSEKFPDSKGPIQRIKGYFNRDKCEVPLNQLMDTNTHISKLELQEYEFQIFRRLIQERHPYISYVAGDKEVVDHGLSKATQSNDNPMGKYVSAEEYAVIRKDKFAEEGWDCVANLKPAYWEFRDIYYRKCDEPVIASVYQHIALQYAKCDSLGDLKARGPMLLQKVPANDFMNFVSLAKANKLRFYIDVLGEYEKPCLDTVNVLYNEHQQKKMSDVLDRMINDKVNFSHVLNTPSRPSLNAVIGEIEESTRGTPSQKNRNLPPFQK